ncbi:MAG TPA: ABC transporter ATP-binding protein, partial [Gemmatimonadota bacterium]|nr:ABC transporter ATP-binding protein [Gemmatimonadota bacterium]
LVRGGLPVALLWVGKLIIDEVVLLAQAGGVGIGAGGGLTGVFGGELTYLWTLVAIELGLAIFSDLLGRGVALVDSLLSDLFTNETSVRLMRHAARLDLRHFEDAEFYDRLERARRQTTGRIALLSQILGQAQDLITIVTLGAGLVIMAPWLIFLLLFALVPAFLGEAHFNSLSYSLMYSWTPERRELDYLRYIGASDATAKEVKIFGLAEFVSERYRQLADALYEANRSLATRRAAWGTALAAVGSIGYYAAFAIIIWRTVIGVFSIGDLTFLAGSFRQLRRLIEGMLTGFSTIAERALYLKDLFDFFDIEPEIAAPGILAAGAGPGGAADSDGAARPVPDPIREGFRFENVSFRYPGTEPWVLRDLSFELRAGEKLALVGENGAGKTTITKLLARLYDPTEGRITLDGTDLREFDPEELRRHIGVIFQDFVRYHMTAADNLAIGRIEARDDRPRLESAAERSLASPVIEELPDAYDQMLGRRFEGGVELSGGEWQKVALGRAYVRDAQLLILDEPTASLDARAEYEVFERFAELTVGKTAVLISHRFSTVRMADRILVLEDGTVRERGTHAELVAADGLYAELFRLQARGYTE